MSSRNRTSAFMRYRESARAHTAGRRSASVAQGAAESSLLSAAISSSTDPDGMAGATRVHIGPGGALPPAWVDISEGVTADMERIKEKVSELGRAHAQALLPTFDDVSSDEHAVEILTQEVSRLFKRAEHGLKQLGAVRDGSEKDAKMRKNMLVSLAGDLQALSQEFRAAQKSYLGKLRQQQAGPASGLSGIDLGFGTASSSNGGGGSFFDDDPGFTDDQMQSMREQEGQVAERESEITSILQSVNDLAQVMRDLSVLVIDQGTILDRIDYNMTEAATQIEEGVVQLQKAEKHQKASKMFLCIMLLAALCILMILVLAVKKLG